MTRRRRLLETVAGLVLVVVAVWGYLWWRAAPDRELAGRFELAFELVDAERSDWRSGNTVTDRNVPCNGELATSHAKVADSRGQIFDPAERSAVDERFAVGFEQMGWEVGRFIPTESPITTSFEVNAIRDRDLIVVNSTGPAAWTSSSWRKPVEI